MSRHTSLDKWEGYQMGNSGRYRLRSSAIRDADTVLRDIRQEDTDEWDASVEGGVEEHLGYSIMMSDECWTLADYRTDEAHVIFGVKSYAAKGRAYASTWMLGTNRSAKDATWLLQAGREFSREFFERWPLTECWSDARNTHHHRWLLWEGYAPNARSEAHGPLGLPFIHFLKEQQPWTSKNTRDAGGNISSLG
jgi:hypothetical protein